MLINFKQFKVTLTFLLLISIIPNAFSEDNLIFKSIPSEVPNHLTIPLKIYNKLNDSQSYRDFSLKIAQISDIHHYSTNLYNADSSVFERFSYNNEGRSVLYTTELLQAMKNKLLSQGIDVLLVTGDMTVLGAEASHRDLASLFKDFESSGIRVFVTTGNHDINNPRAFRITEEGTEPVDNVTPQQFRKIYSDFGYSEATMAHDETLSYLVELDETNYLLALDTSYYQDNSWLGYSVASGIVLPSLYDFTAEAISFARKQGKEIVVMSHHNFLEHYEIDFDLSTFMVHDPQPMMNLLVSGGVHLALSGHIHKSDIKLADVSGSPFYAAALNSFAQYPHTYRLIGIGSNGVGITDYSLAFENALSLNDKILSYNWYIYYHRNFLGQYERLLNNQNTNDALSMAEYFYLANLYSQQGLEEYLPDDIKTSRGARLYSSSESFMKGFAAALPIDSEPSDSDVLISW